VANVILNLSKNKTSGFDGLTAQHLQYAHPSVIMVIAKLLNMMLIYEHVPDAFGESVINLSHTERIQNEMFFNF